MKQPNRCNRRNFLRSSAASVGMLAASRWRALAFAPTQAPAEPLPPWQRGYLDIHHISTGRGNSVLAILPDGTSLLIDAGAKAGSGADLASPRPDASRRPGEWIGRYARHHLSPTPRQQLDYCLITHLHDDHMGGVTADSPLSPDGNYRLSGISDVAAILPIRTLLDRGYPDYTYPTPPTDKSALNYIAFVRSAVARGLAIERFAAGSSHQIHLQHAAAEFNTFSVRNLAVNGEVWTGQGDHALALFPSLTTLDPKQYPTENACSAAVRIAYGKFSYYNGGDLTCDTRFGTTPWMDVETAVARVAGPVSVAALNHHGYFDSTGPEFVRAMRARIDVLQSWHASHPALATLDRLYSPILSTGDHDVLATSLVEASELANARLADRMLSQQGHVVVRVAHGGATYHVLVLDDSREQGFIRSRFGPYVSGAA